MKTNELDGIILDWAVTSIEDPEALRYGVSDWREQRRSKVINGEYVHRYHQSWTQAGQIIDRERIGVWSFDDADNGWCATLGFTEIRNCHTPIIAAMRCYVASKLGDEIEVPEELFSSN